MKFLETQKNKFYVFREEKNVFKIYFKPQWYISDILSKYIKSIIKSRFHQFKKI